MNIWVGQPNWNRQKMDKYVKLHHEHIMVMFPWNQQQKIRSSYVPPWLQLFHKLGTCYTKTLKVTIYRYDLFYELSHLPIAPYGLHTRTYQLANLHLQYAGCLSQRGNNFLSTPHTLAAFQRLSTSGRGVVWRFLPEAAELLPRGIP
jgi:hypothetical protein